MLEEIILLNKVVEDILKEELKIFNISLGQYKVLKKIYMSESNKINANQLSLLLEVDKRTLSLNIKKLEELDYIQRIELKRDRRKKYISLTEIALEMFEDILCIEQEIEEVISNSLKDEKFFLQQIQSIIKNLKN